MNINHKLKYSTDIIAHEVRKFWYNTYPQTVVAFFISHMMELNGNGVKKLLVVKVLMII